MSDLSALVADLTLNRPLCIGCLTVKSKIRISELDAVIRNMEKAQLLHRVTDRCRGCGVSGTTFSVDHRA